MAQPGIAPVERTVRPLGLLARALTTLAVAVVLAWWAGLGEEAPALAQSPLTWVDRAFMVRGMSADGNRVLYVVSPPGGGVLEGRLWTRGAGSQPTGQLDGDPVGPEGLSADGRTMVGSSLCRAVLWREGVGWQQLPLPEGANCGNATAASADGRVVAGGVGWVEGNVPRWAAPAIWEDGQVMGLGMPPGSHPCQEATFQSISPAGDAAAGWVGPGGCPFGALLWRRGSGYTLLGVLPGFDATMAEAVADGGQVVVGRLMRFDGSRYWTEGAFRWTPFGGMERLPGGRAAALAVSADGRVVGGYAQFGDLTRAALWVDGTLRNLHDELSPFLGPGDVLGDVSFISPDGRYVAGMGSRGLDRFVYVAQVPQPPSPPSLVAIWPVEGQAGQAFISWQPPAGATRYRLQSALDPGFGFGVSVIEFPAGPYNLLAVGAPGWDGGVFYYRLAACNEQACSGWSPVLALARRSWPSSGHWDLVAGGFRFLGRAYLWAQNASPLPGKASSLHLYEGLQGFGGLLRRGCQQAPPGGVCQVDFPTSSPLLSASQSFPPYGEVGVGFEVR